MTTASAKRSVTNTLSTTTADAITLTQAWDGVLITNHDSAEYLYVTNNGVVPVGSADDTIAVAPGETLQIGANVNASGQSVIGVVGSGNVYTICGV